VCRFRADGGAVPLEGDLLYGQSVGVVATLVERHSRFVMLLGLPQTHRAASRPRRFPVWRPIIYVRVRAPQSGYQRS
jgi:hypothetical protein